MEDKENLLNILEKFLKQAIRANSYNELIKQYNKNIVEFNDEMNVSSFYYSTVINSLITSCYLELSKIYDTHRDSINIRQMLEKFGKNKEWYPPNTKHTYLGESKETIFPHTYKPKEYECGYFENILGKKPRFNIGNTNFILDVDMSIEDYFKYYNWRYLIIEPKIKNVLKQRNKFHAHNDKKFIENSELLSEEFPVSYSDIDELILFPIDFCRFTIAMLTGVFKADKPVNYEDWENTLETVRKGNNYNSLRVDIAKIVFKNQETLEKIIEDIKKEPSHKMLVEEIESTLNKHGFDSYRTLRL